MQARQLRQSHNGFTLAEILVVLLISTIIVLGINASYRQVYLMWSSAENPRPMHQATRHIVETLRHELAGLYFPTQDANDQAQTAFELQNLQPEQNKLVFYTLTPCWKASLWASRPVKVTYTFVRNQDSEEGVLQREEQLCAGNKPLSQTGLEPDIVLHGLTELDFWIADPNAGSDELTWIQSFTATDKPPRALKVRLKWPDHKHAEGSVFEASLLIPCQASVKQED